MENKIIIINTDKQFVFGCNIFDSHSILKILDIKNIEDTHNIDEIPTCLCQGYYDSVILLNLNPIESKLYNILTKKYWPGELNIMVRAKKIIHTNLLYKDEFICMNSPKNRYIRKILERTNRCIVTLLANNKHSIPITNYKDVYMKYNTYDIPIFDNTKTQISGMNNTTILIENNTIQLVSRGPILFETIKNELSNIYGDLNIKYKISTEHPMCIYYDKPIYNFKIMDINIDITNPTIIEELKQKTHTMLNKIILIDFHKTHYNNKDAFYGYVDISENGDIEEYINNLYSVLHTIKDTECNKIYITDISFITNDNHYINDIISMLTKSKNIVIPYQLL